MSHYSKKILKKQKHPNTKSKKNTSKKIRIDKKREAKKQNHTN